jgi:hypothetical protein
LKPEQGRKLRRHREGVRERIHVNDGTGEMWLG